MGEEKSPDGWKIDDEYVKRKDEFTKNFKSYALATIVVIFSLSLGVFAGMHINVNSANNSLTEANLSQYYDQGMFDMFNNMTRQVQQTNGYAIIDYENTTTVWALINITRR